MRAQNKIAAGVGIVVIALGFFYFRANDKTRGPVADDILGEQSGSTTTDRTPTENVSDAPVADRVASPAPRTVETIRFNANNESPRPQPSVTHNPEPSVNVATAALPERAGLSSLPPAMPADLGNTPDTQIRPAAIEPEVMSADIGTPETDAASEGMPPNIIARDTGSKAAPALRADPLVSPKADVAPPIGAAAQPPATTRTHVLQKGDTYTSLAIKYFGHAKHVKLIEQANPGRDPRRLYVGSKINIPDASAAASPAPVSASPDNARTNRAGRPTAPPVESAPPPDPSRAYTVQRGDSWQSLARRFLGRAESDVELYELNKERVGEDPNLLREGLIIELPARAKMPARTAPTPAQPAPVTPTL